jgi:hypothetical protein
MNHIFKYLLFIILISRTISADPITPYSGNSRKVSASELIPHIDKDGNKSNEYYNEWYSFIFYLKGGYRAYVQFVISNLGLGDGDLVVQAEVALPDSSWIKEKTEFKREQWTYNNSGFEIKAGDNLISGEPGNITIKVKNSKFEAEYNFTNKFSAWKPGNGRVFYGKGESHYYDFKMLAPIAKVTGKIKMANENEFREVSGHGYADHIYTNQPMHMQAKRWIRMRGITSGTAVIMTEFHATEQYANKKVGWIVIFNKGKKLFETLNPVLTPSDFKVDNQSPNQYQIPQTIKIEAEEGGSKLVGAMKVTKSTGREDILEKMGSVKKAIVSKFAQPVSYDYNCEFAFELTSATGTETLSGKCRYYFTQVMR